MATALEPLFLQPGDRTHLVQTLPGQADHECVELRLAERHRHCRVYLAGPHEGASIEPPCGTPHTKAVVHEHLDARGPGVGKQVAVVGKREQMALFFANFPTCLIGMEACGSAHHWARKLQSLGYTVRLVAPQFVKPYVKTNKNDAADAEAICEAVGRPNIRFVPVKNVEQQAVLALHRVRQRFIKARTAQANQIRGLLAEFGLIVPQGIGHIAGRVPELIEDASNELPCSFRMLVAHLVDHLKVLDTHILDLEAKIKAWHRESELSRRLEQIPGIGPVTASAMLATIDDAKAFESGRQLAAWLRPGKRRLLNPFIEPEFVAERVEKMKASIRAKVKHPFRVIKQQFGFTKVHYRGLVKNIAQTVTLFAVPNLWMARRRLMQAEG